MKISFTVIGLEFDGCRKLIASAQQISAMPQHVAECVMGFCPIRTQSNRLLIGLDGAIKVPRTFECVSQIKARFRQVGVEAGRLAKFHEGGAFLSCLQQSPSWGIVDRSRFWRLF